MTETQADRFYRLFSQACVKNSVHILWQGGMHGRRACVAGEMATVADGMHPTGMHSCFVLIIASI